jgi:hypothetical protein
LADTNIIHRGGMQGARYAADAAAGFLAAGGVGAPHWCERAVRVHIDFIDRNLSPGGCADLDAVSARWSSSAARMFARAGSPTRLATSAICSPAPIGLS